MKTDSTFIQMGEWLIKSSAIVLLATSIVTFWRSATAAQRHLVYLCALATLLLLPLTWLARPVWLLPIAEMKDGFPSKSLSAVVVGSSNAPRRAAISNHERFNWTLPDGPILLTGVWLAGAASLLAYRFVGTAQRRKLECRSALLREERIATLAEAIFRELEISRPVQIRISEACRVPMTWGTLRPRLLLPAEALTWNESRLATALRHEAGHIRRCDHLARCLGQLGCALYWPNPMVWIAARLLWVAQEQAADDLVLRSGAPAQEYAAQLFEAARAVGRRGFVSRQAVAMAGPSTLQTRIVAILDGKRSRSPLNRLAMAIGTLAALLILGICGAAQSRAVDAPAGTSRSADGKSTGTNDVSEELVTKEWKAPPGLFGPSVTDWLTAHGVKFGPGASAAYLGDARRLVMRNTKAEIERASKVIEAAIKAQPPARPEGAGAQNPAPLVQDAENPLWARATRIIIPKIDAREASVAEVVDFLQKKAIDADPDKQGVKIVLKPGTTTTARLTMKLTNIPLIEALRYVAGLAELDLVAGPDSLILQTQKAPTAAPK